MSRAVIQSIELEYRRYKALGEKSLAQVQDDQLCVESAGGGNSLAILVRHMSGNLKSRFTDFLTTDGEKPWRNRESEFSRAPLTRAEIDAMWESGWQVLFDAIEPLTDADLFRTVQIRGQSCTVIEALHRSVAHAAYHSGQMVFLARGLCGDSWQFLSIPPGGTAAYNRNPTIERGFK
jgi:uncharacterized damage-inducible protein DinB